MYTADLLLKICLLADEQYHKMTSEDISIMHYYSVCIMLHKFADRTDNKIAAMHFFEVFKFQLHFYLMFAKKLLKSRENDEDLV